VVEETIIAPTVIHKHELDENQAAYTILDVRSESAFKDTNTFPNAINIPIEQLIDRLAELNKDRIYIPYCG
jgi:rhodanese-related sulfurtransferase